MPEKETQEMSSVMFITIFSVRFTLLYYIPYCPEQAPIPKQAPTPPPAPPILIVLWFFEVLSVTAHHAKFLCSESEGRSAELTAAIVLRMPRHQASKVRTHLSVALFAAFFPCSTKFAYCKQRLNAAETWQQGYESVSFVARYSFLHYQAGLDEARSDDVVHPGSLLRIRCGPLLGDS